MPQGKTRKESCLLRKFPPQTSPQLFRNIPLAICIDRVLLSALSFMCSRFSTNQDICVRSIQHSVISFPNVVLEYQKKRSMGISWRRLSYYILLPNILVPLKGEDDFLPPGTELFSKSVVKSAIISSITWSFNLFKQLVHYSDSTPTP